MLYFQLAAYCEKKKQLLTMFALKIKNYKMICKDHYASRFTMIWDDDFKTSLWLDLREGERERGGGGQRKREMERSKLTKRDERESESHEEKQVK